MEIWLLGAYYNHFYNYYYPQNIKVSCLRFQGFGEIQVSQYWKITVQEEKEEEAVRI
jgi:DNA gyrase/topoisomerase IV subunit B